MYSAHLVSVCTFLYLLTLQCLLFFSQNPNFFEQLFCPGHLLLLLSFQLPSHAEDDSNITDGGNITDSHGNSLPRPKHMSDNGMIYEIPSE